MKQSTACAVIVTQRFTNLLKQRNTILDEFLNAPCEDHLWCGEPLNAHTHLIAEPKGSWKK